MAIFIEFHLLFSITILIQLKIFKTCAKLKSTNINDPLMMLNLIEGLLDISYISPTRTLIFVLLSNSLVSFYILPFIILMSSNGFTNISNPLLHKVYFFLLPPLFNLQDSMIMSGPLVLKLFVLLLDIISFLAHILYIRNSRKKYSESQSSSKVEYCVLATITCELQWLMSS